MSVTVPGWEHVSDEMKAALAKGKEMKCSNCQDALKEGAVTYRCVECKTSDKCVLCSYCQ